MERINVLGNSVVKDDQTTKQGVLEEDVVKFENNESLNACWMKGDEYIRAIDKEEQDGCDDFVRIRSQNDEIFEHAEEDKEEPVQRVNGPSRVRVPLYLLDPDDFSHDPKKQIQIRRAIITYRHHESKKEQIIKLTEENKELREHQELLKQKILELSQCGCYKNQSADLDIVDVVIPEVAPRMKYLGRNGQPALAVKCNKFSAASVEHIRDNLKADDSTASCPLGKTTPEEVKVHKPLINLTFSTLSRLNCNEEVATQATRSLAPMGRTRNRKVVKNPAPVKSPPNGVSPCTPPSIQTTDSRVNSAGLKPLDLLALVASVKNETTSLASTPPASLTPNQMTTVKFKTQIPESPATAPTASRIVFQKRKSNEKTFQAISQFISNPNYIPLQKSSIQPTSRFPISTQMTASQLALKAKKMKTTMRGTSPLTSINRSDASPPQRPNQVYRTPSGHLLKLVHSEPMVHRNPNRLRKTKMLNQPRS